MVILESFQIDHSVIKDITLKWEDGTESMFSGIWYSEKKVKSIVENHIQSRGI